MEPRPKRRRLRPWLIAIGVSLLVVLALGGLKLAQIRTLITQSKAHGPPPETVTTAAVQQDEWPAMQSAVGTLVAERATQLSVEVPGAVHEILFVDGATIGAGEVLVQLDTSTEEAQLDGALADDQLARSTLQRTAYLRSKGAATVAEVQAAQARAQQARAAVTGLRALIAKKTLRAPFAGRIGIRQVELGQVVAAGAPVASLQTVDPMQVEITLPQRALEGLELGQRVRVTVGQQTTKGRVTTINPELDSSTRNVRVRATLANTDGSLLPGMAASVDVYSGAQDPVRVVPASAIIYAPYGDSVFVIKGEQAPFTVEQRFVRIGDRRGDFVAVLEGLDPKETVVSTGAFKLKNGMTVVVDNTLAPRAELEPQPENR